MMNLPGKILVSLFFLCGIKGFAQYGQINSIDSVAGHFITALRKTNGEKLLLETDRQLYGAGETIWFKTFLLQSLNNKPLQPDKNIYVDLVDSKDKVFKQVILNAAKQQTDGAFVLSDTLAGGYYWLRASTRAILQQNPGRIGLQPIYIVNTKRADTINYSLIYDSDSSAKNEQGTFVQFFPEGGAVMTGINSVIALKVTDSRNHPLQVHGYVKSNNDSVVANFTTSQSGLAKFSFSPVWFKQYTVYVSNNGSITQWPIPAFNSFAAQLALVNNSNGQLKFWVTLEDSIYSAKYTTYLLGISNDSLCYAGVGRGMYEAMVPLYNFPAGEATFLLFNEHKQLLSERKAFINKKKDVVNIKSDKNFYGPRENVRLDISVTDAAVQPLMAAFTVSVNDNRIIDLTDEINKDGIVSLDNQRTIAMADAEMDLAMLTQPPEYAGWYKQAEQSLKIPDSSLDDLSVKGRVLNSNNQAVTKQSITVFSADKKSRLLLNDSTDANGRFRFPYAPETDNMLLNFQIASVNGVQNQRYKIELDTFSFPVYRTPIVLKKQFINDGGNGIAKKSSTYLDTVFIGAGKGWLKPVTVKSVAKKQVTYDESKRKSNFSKIITNEMLEDGGVNNVGFAVLRVPGVQLRNGYVTINGLQGFKPGPQIEPLLILDGVPLPIDTNVGIVGESSPVMTFLSTLNINTIDFVEVLTGPEAAAYGARAATGVIVINTKTSINKYIDPKSGLKKIYVKGYHNPPEFPMPDYSKKEIKNNHIDDVRTTIYWNANIVTDSAGRAVVNFYTADNAATYTVTVKGITVNGEKIFKTIVINRR